MEADGAGGRLRARPSADKRPMSSLSNKERGLIRTDSEGCVDLSYDPVSFRKTKHILRDAEGLRDCVARMIFVMVHIQGTTNLADILTKAQSVKVFRDLMALYFELHAPSP